MRYNVDVQCLVSSLMEIYGKITFSPQPALKGLNRSHFFRFPSLFLFPGMASADVKAELCCSICKEFYKDPVTLICGHSYCRVCITKTFQHQGKEDYKCPICSRYFKVLPELNANWSLRNLADRLSSIDLRSKEPGFICTYCIHSPVPAVKTCLLCEAHLCDDHLKVHSEAREHMLIEPTLALDTRKCSIHKRVLEYYCTNDAALICSSCKLGSKHLGHHVEPMDEAYTKKKKELSGVLDSLSTMREKTQKRLHALEDERGAVPLRASGVRERFTNVFRDIRRHLEDLEKRVLKEISRQEEQLLLSVSKLIQELEAKKGELSERMSDIEKMCQMTDPVTFLLEATLESQDFSDADDDQVRVLRNFEESVIVMLVNTGMAEMVTFLQTTMNVPESSDLLLDENTAANDVDISEDLKTASWSKINQKRPNRPERFRNFQVLTTKRFSSGQHFWCVEANGSGSWMVGLSYPSLDRKGCLSCIGYNNKSWGLCKYVDNQYLVIHEGREVHVPHLFSYHILGIYLDYEGGRMSFYELGDPIRHLHTFSATFTEPLHAALYVGKDATVKIIN